MWSVQYGKYPFEIIQLFQSDMTGMTGRKQPKCTYVEGWSQNGSLNETPLLGLPLSPTHSCIAMRPSDDLESSISAQGQTKGRQGIRPLG